MGPYVVDSNFFIQAHRSTYPLDVFPSFWAKVKQLAAAGTLISIDKVRQEIFRNDDELKAWCEANLPDSFFQDTTQVLASYALVVNWAYSRKTHYLPKALDEFLDADEADAWLVSYAHAHNITIITHELSEPKRQNKIKIPDACLPFGVRYTTTIEMLRQLGERF